MEVEGSATLTLPHATAVGAVAAGVDVLDVSDVSVKFTGRADQINAVLNDMTLCPVCAEEEYLPALEAAATVCIPVSVAVSLSDGQPQKHNLRSGTRV